MTEALSVLTRVSIGGSLIEFVNSTIAETRELIPDEDGIRGTRTRLLARAVQGLIKVGGSLKFNPTPADMSGVWPYIAGSSGDTFTDTMQDVTVIVDRGTAAESYSGRFNKIKLSGSSGKKLECEMEFVGYSMTSGSALTGQPDVTNRPYMFMDGALTINSTSYQIDQFELEVDNHIDPTFMMGQIATDLYGTDREVTLTPRFKFTSTEAGLLATARTGPVFNSPCTASLAFTNGANSMTFAFTAVVATPNSVPITDKKKLRMTLPYKCFGTSSGATVTPEVVATFV